MRKYLLFIVGLMCMFFCGCDNIKYTIVTDEGELQELCNKVNEATLSFDEYVNLDLSITASDAKTGLVKPLNLKGSLKAVFSTENSKMKIILSNTSDKIIANIFDDGNDCYVVMNEYKIYGQTILDDEVEKDSSNLSTIEELFLDKGQPLLDKFDIKINEVTKIKKNVSASNQTTKLLIEVDSNIANNAIKQLCGISINLSSYNLSQTYFGVTINNDNVITELRLETEAVVSSTPVSIKFVAKAVYSVPSVENTIDMTLFNK